MKKMHVRPPRCAFKKTFLPVYTLKDLWLFFFFFFTKGVYCTCIQKKMLGEKAQGRFLNPNRLKDPDCKLTRTLQDVFYTSQQSADWTSDYKDSSGAISLIALCKSKACVFLTCLSNPKSPSCVADCCHSAWAMRSANNSHLKQKFSSQWVRPASFFFFLHVLCRDKTCAFSVLFACLLEVPTSVLNFYCFCLFFKEK